MRGLGCCGVNIISSESDDSGSTGTEENVQGVNYKSLLQVGVADDKADRYAAASVPHIWNCLLKFVGHFKEWHPGHQLLSVSVGEPCVREGGKMGSKDFCHRTMNNLGRSREGRKENFLVDGGVGCKGNKLNLCQWIDKLDISSFVDVNVTLKGCIKVNSAHDSRGIDNNT